MSHDQPDYSDLPILDPDKVFGPPDVKGMIERGLVQPEVVEAIDYDRLCAEAATRQGLDPVMDTLARRGVRHGLAQTGGYCMAVTVPVPSGTFAIINDTPIDVEANSNILIGFYPGTSWEESGEVADEWDLPLVGLDAWALAISGVQGIESALRRTMLEALDIEDSPARDA